MKRDLPGTAAALLLIHLSGNPIFTTSENYDVLLVISAAALAIYAFFRGIDFKSLPILLATVSAFCVWHLFYVLNGAAAEPYSLLGEFARILIAYLFVSSTPNAPAQLIRAMVVTAAISIPIYLVRQMGLLAGFDIAQLFNSFYGKTSALSDRSIIIFNFDNPSEAARNSGAFREPGLFAANLIISSVVLLSGRVNISTSDYRIALGVFAAALVTTGSTLGIVALPVLAVLFALRPVAGSNVAKPGRVVLVAFALAVGTFALPLTLASHRTKIEYQLTLAKTESNTWYQSRFGNTAVDYLAIRERPLIGYGFSEIGRPQLWQGNELTGFGNGLTGTIVKFGALMGLFLYCLVIRGIWALHPRLIPALAAISLLAFSLFSQQLLTMPLMYVFLFLAYEPLRKSSAANTRSRSVGHARPLIGS